MGPGDKTQVQGNDFTNWTISQDSQIVIPMEEELWQHEKQLRQTWNYGQTQRPSRLQHVAPLPVIQTLSLNSVYRDAYFPVYIELSKFKGYVISQKSYQLKALKVTNTTLKHFYENQNGLWEYLEDLGVKGRKDNP